MSRALVLLLVVAILGAAADLGQACIGQVTAGDGNSGVVEGPFPWAPSSRVPAGTSCNVSLTVPGGDSLAVGFSHFTMVAAGLNVSVSGAFFTATGALPLPAARLIGTTYPYNLTVAYNSIQVASYGFRMHWELVAGPVVWQCPTDPVVLNAPGTFHHPARLLNGYNANENCVWLLNATSGVVRLIVIDAQTGVGDFVTVYDGDSVASPSLGKAQRGSVFYSSSGFMTVQFTSNDDGVLGAGIWLQWEESAPPSQDVSVTQSLTTAATVRVPAAWDGTTPYTPATRYSYLLQAVSQRATVSILSARVAPGDSWAVYDGSASTNRLLSSASNLYAANVTGSSQFLYVEMISSGTVPNTLGQSGLLFDFAPNTKPAPMCSSTTVIPPSLDGGVVQVPAAFDGVVTYANYLDCSWTISLPADAPAGSALSLVVMNLSLAAGDQIIAYDGASKQIIAANWNNMNVWSAAGPITLRFVSDGAEVSTGFAVKWSVFTPKSDCGVYSTADQKITLGTRVAGNTYGYNRNLACSWNISTTATALRITIDADLARGDVLSFVDDNTGRVIGVTNGTFTTSSSSLQVSFSSDATYMGRGFTLTYAAAGVPVNHCKTYQNITVPADQFAVAAAASGTAVYLPGSSCVIDVLVPAGNTVFGHFNSTRFADAKLTAGDATYGNARLQFANNGTTLNSLTGVMTTDTYVQSRSNVLRFEFTSEPSLSAASTDRTGPISSFQPVAQCLGRTTLSGASGGFSVPNPFNPALYTYGSSLDCEWVIPNPGGTQLLRLWLSDDSVIGLHDVVTVYSGTSRDQANILFTKTSTEPLPLVVNTMAEAVLVTLFTDAGSTVAAGLNLKFDIITPPTGCAQSSITLTGHNTSASFATARLADGHTQIVPDSSCNVVVLAPTPLFMSVVLTHVRMANGELFTMFTNDSNTQTVDYNSNGDYLLTDFNLPVFSGTTNGYTPTPFVSLNYTTPDPSGLTFPTSTGIRGYVVACSVGCAKCIAGGLTLGTQCLECDTSHANYVKNVAGTACVAATNCGSGATPVAGQCVCQNVQTTTGTCQPTCPRGSYLPGGKLCQTCSTGCNLCSGPGILRAAFGGTCTTCAESQGYAIEKENNHMYCTKCPVGQFQNKTTSGNFMCEYCTEGCLVCTKAGLSATYCSVCDNANGYGYDPSRACLKCPAGQYVGSTKFCTACTTGCSQCQAPGLLMPSQCLKCDTANSYYEAADGKSCVKTCPKGSFFDPTSTPPRCRACSVGCGDCTAPGLDLTSGVCKSCDASVNFAVAPGDASCQRCPGEQYADDTQTPSRCADVTCLQPPNTYYSVCEEGATRGATCQVGCAKGFIGSTITSSCLGLGQYTPYPACTACSVRQWAAPLSTECTDCVHGHNAGPIGSVSECLCDSGYYVSGGACVSCPAGGQCDGNFTQPYSQPGYYPSGAIFVVCSPPEACSGNGTCAEGYEKLLCGKCTTGYFKINGKCKTCPKVAGLNVGLTVVFGSLCVLALVILARAKTAGDRSITMASPHIALVFLQTASMFSSMTFDWPERLLTIFDLFSTMNLNIEILNADCIIKVGIYGKTLTELVMPLVIAGLFGMVFALYAGIVALTYTATKESLRARLRTGFLEFCAGYVLFLDCIYMFLAKTSFQLFHCIERADGTYTMFDAPGDLCYQGRWWNNLPYAIIGILIYVIGIPLALGRIYPRIRSRYGNAVGSMAASMHNMTSFYVRRFEPVTWYWELIIIGRRAVVVILITFLGNSPIGQKVGLLITFFAACVATIAVGPYEWDAHDVVECISIITTLLIVAATFLFGTDGVDSSDYGPIASGLVGVIVICCLLIGFAFLAEIFGMVRYFAALWQRKDLVASFESELTESLVCVGSTLVTGGADGSVRAIETEGGTVTAVMTGHEEEVTCLVEMGEERYVASGSTDGTVRIWRVKDWTLAFTLTPGDEAITSLSEGTNALAVGMKDGRVAIYRLEGALAESAVYQAKKVDSDNDYSDLVNKTKKDANKRINAIRDLAKFNAPGAVGTGAGVAAGTGPTGAGAPTPVGSQPAKKKNVSGSGVGSGSSKGASSLSEQAETEDVSAATSASASSVDLSSVASGSRRSRNRSKSKASLTVGSDDMEEVEPELVRIFEAHDTPITSVALDDDLLYTGCTNGYVRVWDMNDVIAGGNDMAPLGDWAICPGRSIRVLFVHTVTVYVGCGDGLILSINTESSRTYYFVGHRGAITGLALHKNLLMSSSNDRNICIWDIKTDECLYTLRHSLAVTAVVWHDDPQEPHLYSTGDDRTIKKWLVRDDDSWKIDPDPLSIFKKRFCKQRATRHMRQMSLEFSRDNDDEELGVLLGEMDRLDDDELDAALRKAGKRRNIENDMMAIMDFDREKKQAFLLALR